MGRAFFYFILAVFPFMFSALAMSQECTPTQYDQTLWDAASKSNDPALTIYYLDKVPKGCYREIAIIKLNGLVPERPLIVISATTNVNPAEISAGNGDDFYAGGFHYLIFKVQENDRLAFAYKCDGAGVTHSGTEFSQGQRCPGNWVSSMQGFSLKLVGSYAKYYDLNYRCEIIPGGQTQQKQADEWCGVPFTEGARNISRLRVDLVRKKFGHQL